MTSKTSSVLLNDLQGPNHEIAALILVCICNQIMHTFFTPGSDLLMASSVGLVINWWKEENMEL